MMFKTQMEEYMKSKNIIQDEESSYESEYILRCCPGKVFFFKKIFNVSDFSGRLGHFGDHKEKISSLAHL